MKRPSPEALIDLAIAAGRLGLVPVLAGGGILFSQGRPATPDANLNPNKDNTPTEPGVVPTLEAAGVQLVLPDPRDAQLSLTLNRGAALSAPALGGLGQRQGEPSPTATTVPMLSPDGKWKDVEVYDEARLKAEGYNPASPDTYANKDIEACKATQVLAQRGRDAEPTGNRLVNFLGRLIEPGKVEAAELNSVLEAPAKSISDGEKEKFVNCVQAVEAKRPVLGPLGKKVNEWKKENVVDRLSIKDWRIRIYAEAKNRGVDLNQSQIDQLLGSEVRSVFLQKDGTLAPFTAKIENLSVAELEAKYGKQHPGIHSYEEEVYIVVHNGEVIAVWGDCTNVVIPVPKKDITPVPAVPTATTAPSSTPTPEKKQDTATPTATSTQTGGGPGPGPSATPTSPATTTIASATPTSPAATPTVVPTATPTVRTAETPQTVVPRTPSGTPGPTNTPQVRNTPIRYTPTPGGAPTRPGTVPQTAVVQTPSVEAGNVPRGTAQAYNTPMRNEPGWNPLVGVPANPGQPVRHDGINPGAPANPDAAPAAQAQNQPATKPEAQAVSQPANNAAAKPETAAVKPGAAPDKPQAVNQPIRGGSAPDNKPAAAGSAPKPDAAKPADAPKPADKPAEAPKKAAEAPKPADPKPAEAPKAAPKPAPVAVNNQPAPAPAAPAPARQGTQPGKKV